MSKLMIGAQWPDARVSNMKHRIAEYKDSLQELQIVDELRQDIAALINHAQQSMEDKWPDYCIKELLDTIGEQIEAVGTRGRGYPILDEQNGQNKRASSLPPTD